MLTEQLTPEENLEVVNYLEHIMPSLVKYIEGEDRFTALSVAMSMLANVVVAHGITRRELHLALEIMMADMENNGYIPKEVD
jgi:hypothetical protein